MLTIVTSPKKRQYAITLDTYPCHTHWCLSDKCSWSLLWFKKRQHTLVTDSFLCSTRWCTSDVYCCLFLTLSFTDSHWLYIGLMRSEYYSDICVEFSGLELFRRFSHKHYSQPCCANWFLGKFKNISNNLYMKCVGWIPGVTVSVQTILCEGAAPAKCAYHRMRV